MEAASVEIALNDYSYGATLPWTIALSFVIIVDISNLFSNSDGNCTLTEFIENT